MQTQRQRRNTQENNPLPPRGPSVDSLAEAIEEVTTHTVPGTLSVGAVETIDAAAGFPFSAGTRTVREAGVKNGDPRSGHKRSDDHISTYEIVLPVRELDFETVDTTDIELEASPRSPLPSCSECGCREAVYKYSAHHHESVRWVVGCPRCETRFDGD
jgi:hypothetical protein